MNRKALRLALLVEMVALGSTGVSGCGGGAKYKDASVEFDVHADTKDATTTTDSKTDTGSSTTPPTPGPGSKLIVGGAVQLIGSGPDSCTSQVPASGDRWCGFAKRANLSNFELWVVNVTKAAAGVTIKCDASTADANCLRLSTGLFQDPTNAFRIHLFDGDTLTYSEVPSSSTTGFIGTVFAWRPNWAAGRQISSNTGLGCSGHKSTRAAICIENPVIDAAQTFETAELHAGFLDDQTGALHLPLVDTVILQTSVDLQGVSKVGFRLTPDGQSVAWSTRADTMSTEDLRVQKVGDDSTRVKVAADVTQWTVSPDSKSWYWLQGYNYDVTNGAPAGTLQSAAFPGGAAPTTIGTAVADYNQAGDKGLFYRTKVKADLGTLMVTPDRDAPTAASMVDTGVFFVFEASKDGKNASYTKNVDVTTLGSNFPIFDLFIGSGSAVPTTPCALAKTQNAFLPPNFIGGSGTMVWGQIDKTTGAVSGVATTAASCTASTFGNDVFTWVPVGNEGLVYLDAINSDPTVDEATLRFGKVTTAGVLPNPGTVIQERAGLTFATLLPSLSAVVYVVTSKTSADGLYINATLPFTVTTPSATDGGAQADTGTPVPEAGSGDASDGGAGDADPNG
jgi:hypothetical protein